MDEFSVRCEWARGICRRAGLLHRDARDTMPRAELKADGTGWVTEADRAAEAFIVEAVCRRWPGERVVAEEGGGVEGSASGWCWYVDPLDGTTNFLHGYPMYCVSLAACFGDFPVVAAVHVPPFDHLYHATAGGGAWLEDERLQVSTTSAVAEALIGVGDLRWDGIDAEAAGLAFTRLVGRARGVRRSGSVILDLCHVAAGRLDGACESRARPWDLAAGILLVREAGGSCTNRKGRRIELHDGEVLASNGELHEAIYALA